MPAGRPGLAHLIAAARRGSAAVRARRSVYRDRAWVDPQPARVLPGHQTAQVRKLAQRAQQIERTDLTRFIGKGHFGAVYALDDDTIVKLPAIYDIHGRRWEPEQIKPLLLHEAGISNELAAAGLRIVPRTVYVELRDGTPALVRERGVEVERATWDQLAELEAGLDAVERLGYRVDDKLLVMQRLDGSLFVADVGLWEAPSVGEVPQILKHRTELNWLINEWAESKGLKVPKGFVFLPALHGLKKNLAWALEVAEPEPDGSEDRFVAIARQQLATAQRLRRQKGWPT